MSKIALSAGHTLSGKGSGAISGIYSESILTRGLLDKLMTEIQRRYEYGALKHDYQHVITNVSDDYLYEQSHYINGHNFDYAIQFHFNMGGGTGTEVWEWEPSDEGKLLSGLLANIMCVNDRGTRDGKAKSLRFLRLTKMKSFLVEVCFMDNNLDMGAYTYNIDDVVNTIITFCENNL